MNEAEETAKRLFDDLIRDRAPLPTSVRAALVLVRERLPNLYLPIALAVADALYEMVLRSQEAA
jgi:hypothetical protein